MSDIIISQIHRYRRLKNDIQRLLELAEGLSASVSNLIDVEEQRFASHGRIEPPIPSTIHDHRPGGRMKLDMDPDQAAFIDARLGYMTYTEIADAAASYFGSDRAVKKSTVHKWHRRSKE